jgi:hypothetical protein
MSCSNIFGLKMLKLRIYIEPVASLQNKSCQNLKQFQSKCKKALSFYKQSEDKEHSVIWWYSQ